ncbi:hypothetical protein [Xanthobacter autotrophicus]|uniref:Uncharacterized protein n=1 Tax=Xanthobacter autotrophicus TaxID=280 RepID=A0A6C1KE66_XANAU|nr:hypothetical protein [Xanthobacter autotrophicus]TLX42452.1 hypothetical protein FBQ73_12430 [Xanthobacter autotrophicus]
MVTAAIRSAGGEEGQTRGPKTTVAVRLDRTAHAEAGTPAPKDDAEGTSGEMDPPVKPEGDGVREAHDALEHVNRGRKHRRHPKRGRDFVPPVAASAYDGRA